MDSVGDGTVGGAKIGAMLLTLVLVGGIFAANQWSLERPENGALNTIEVDSSGDLTIVADEANDATLVLDADQGDDTADTWTIESEASGNDLSIMNGTTEVLNLTSGGTLTLPAGGIVGSGTKGALVPAGIGTMTAVEYVYGNLHNVTITCTAMGFVMLDEAGVTGHGGTNIYTYPEGLICNLGAVIDGSITGAGDAYQSATWDGDIALGTTLVDNTATPMATTQQDILQNTDTTTAIAQVGNCDAQSIATILTESGARWLDGTAAAKGMYFNTLTDESADNEDGGTNTFTGTIEFSYLVVGDN